MYIAQDPQSFWTQIHLNAGDRFDSLKHPLSAIGAEVLRYRLAFGLGPHSAGHASALIALKSFVLALYIAGIVAALIVPKLRSYSYLRLQVLLALLYFTIQLFFNQKLSYYLMHTTPLYCSILAAFLLWAWERRGLMRTAAAGAVAVCIALGAGGIVLRSAGKRTTLHLLSARDGRDPPGSGRTPIFRVRQRRAGIRFWI